MILTPVTAIISLFFFFNDTATTEIYTLSLHDALPICDDGRDRDLLVAPLPQGGGRPGSKKLHLRPVLGEGVAGNKEADRKSTRLNSSHSQISYAVFCLKKKKKTKHTVKANPGSSYKSY